MKFTDTLRDKLLLKLGTLNREPDAGSFCFFIRLNSRVGAKLYTNKYKRNFAWETQQRAFESDIAPVVGDMFDIKLWIGPYQKKRLYGYLTQIAVMKNTSEELLQGLITKMTNAGFAIIDIANQHNCGFIKDKLVCIDFDPVSMGK